jgi:hypothetical protein
MSNSIRAITEDKLVAYVQANTTGLTIHKGITDEVRILPLVIIHADSSSKPNALGSSNYGNYRVGVKVYIYSSADDDTLQTHRDRVSNIIGLLTNFVDVKTAWGTDQGEIYNMWLESDAEGMSQRRYGNAISFTLQGVLAPQV